VIILILIYKGTYAGNLNPIYLGQSLSGEVTFQLPPGIESNSYNLSLYVNISDESDGFTQYNISDQVRVEPNNTWIDNLSQNILDSSSWLISFLKNGSFQSVVSFMNSFAFMLNSQSSNVSLLIKLIKYLRIIKYSFC
jgi:hypothetical protein